MTTERKTPYNSTYPKVAAQWLNQTLCFYQSLCLVDSEVLRNRHLRVAAKRYLPIVDGAFIFGNSEVKPELIADKQLDAKLNIVNSEKFNFLKSYYDNN